MQVQYQNAINLINSGELLEARLLLIDLLKENINSAQILAAMANAEYKLGAGFRAEILLNAALTIEPNNAKITQFLNTVKEKPSNKLKGTLGLSMIVKNEEDNIADAINSVKDIADEIVITDTGSEDNTIKIAKELGAKVYETTWDNDFAKVRNFSLERNTAEWVLYLDADERLSIKSLDLVQNLVKNTDNSIGAYVCSILSAHQTNYNEKKYDGKYPRLFRNYGYPFVYFFGKIHEQISPFILDLGKKVRNSDIVIDHHGYDIPQDEMRAKVKRNLNTLIVHTKSEPANALAWYQLGMTLAQMQLNDEATNVLRQALELKSLDGYLLSNLHLTLANIYMQKNDYKNAALHSHDSLTNTVNPIPAMNLLGHSILRLNKPKEALQIFESIKELNKSNEYLLEIDFPDDAIDRAIEMIKKSL